MVKAMTKRVGMQSLYREYPDAQPAPVEKIQLLRGIKREHAEHGFRAVHPSRLVRLQQVPPVIAAEYQTYPKINVFNGTWYLMRSYS